MRNVMWGAGLVALVFGGAGESHARSSGAPLCSVNATYVGVSMANPKNLNSGGFVITSDTGDYTPGGAVVSLTVDHPSGTGFEGILVTPVDDAGNVVGTFENQSDGFQVTCADGALTHSNASPAITLTFDWVPPSEGAGDVSFIAYVYADNNEFYQIIGGDAPVVTENEVDAGPPVDAGDPIDGGDPIDAGDPVDGGAPEDDAGVEPDDAGVAPPQDAGGDPPQDAGPEPEDDAGTAEPEEDAGPVDPPVGCACEASSAPANGFALAFALIGLRLIGRRRRRK